MMSLRQDGLLATKVLCQRAVPYPRAPLMCVGLITAICFFVANGLPIEGMRFGVVAERFDTQMPNAKMVKVRYGRPAASIELEIGYFTDSRARVWEIKSFPMINVRWQPHAVIGGCAVYRQGPLGCPSRTGLSKFRRLLERADSSLEFFRYSG
jgi:hypothetical protein